MPTLFIFVFGISQAYADQISADEVAEVTSSGLPWTFIGVISLILFLFAGGYIYNRKNSDTQSDTPYDWPDPADQW